MSSLTRLGFYAHPRSRASGLQTLRACIAKLQPNTTRVDKLRPRDFESARLNTLSAKHGLGLFPPHTDFALRSLPPRYIALFCPVARPGGTTLYCGKRLHEGLPSGTFRIKTATKSYSATFVNTSRHGRFYRYNADLMCPLDRDAQRLAEAIDLAKPDHIVYWHKISWIIIDNWSFLHGREPTPERTGWLWRIALETHT